jgi:hypothetical protein
LLQCSLVQGPIAKAENNGGKQTINQSEGTENDATEGKLDFCFLKKSTRLSETYSLAQGARTVKEQQ